MPLEAVKVPGGLEVDGVIIRSGKCGCTSFAACCYTWSKVKKKGSTIVITAKTAAPDTEDTFSWSYKVQKDGTTISVNVDDARDKVTFSGFMPPSLSIWVERGWEVLEQDAEREDGRLFRCGMCKWLYKEDKEGVKFEDLSDDWKCGTCSATKESFEEI